MTSPVANHLSDEAFDDLLIGMASPQSRAHLEECPECSARLSQFQAGIANFNATSMAWMESKAARRPVIAKPRTTWFPTPLLGLCAAAALVVMIGLPSAIPVQHGYNAPVQAVPDLQDSQVQIAQDNALMKDVEAAINPDDASLVDEYHLVVAPGVHFKSQPKRGSE